MNVLGLDIGGANIKVCDGSQALSRAFALWRTPDRLPSMLHELINGFSGINVLAVTMTGELADCFATREEGVRRILDAVQEAAGDRQVLVWQTGGEFVSLDEAQELWRLTAAANWHALATWAGRSTPTGGALLIDIGSTTTDIIPLRDGLPAPRGRTDFERLASGELLYLGVRRTPLCALASEVSLGTQKMGVARELFATTLDVGLLLGHIAEDPDNTDTANGRSATREAAEDRMARMVASDRLDLTREEIITLAREFDAALLRELTGGIRRVLPSLEGNLQHVIVAGEGESRAIEAIGKVLGELPRGSLISLTNLLGADVAKCACAFAVQRLAGEHVSPA